MTPITDKIKALPDGLTVWTNICDPKDGKWKTNVQAFDSTDLKKLVSELETKTRALEQWRCSSCRGNAQYPHCSICLSHDFKGAMVEHECNELGMWLCPGCDGMGLNRIAQAALKGVLVECF